jgi:hypothetical protein
VQRSEAIEPERSARHFIDSSAEATCQVAPGRGYRILDMKPGTFE